MDPPRNASILGDAGILGEVQIHSGCHPHLCPPQSGLWFEGWQVMPDELELVSWASASGENQRAGRAMRGPTRGGREKGRHGGKRKNAPLPGCRGRDGLGLPGAHQEVTGVGSRRDRRMAPLLNLRRILLVRTGHTKQRLRWEPAFLSHLLSWESTGLRSVKTASFGVWYAPEPQVRACSPLLSSSGHMSYPHGSKTHGSQARWLADWETPCHSTQRSSWGNASTREPRPQAGRGPRPSWQEACRRGACPRAVSHTQCSH